MLKSKSIQFPRAKDDGVRICVMRFVRSYYDFDEWYKELAPSITLLNDYKNKKILWQEYEKRYLEEIKDKSSLLQKIKDLSEKGDVTLLCCEKEDEFCHRRLLINNIKEMISQ